MAKGSKSDVPVKKGHPLADYDLVLNGVAELLESARRTSARATNAIMTATYWEIGRRIVESEQSGEKRAEYGERLLERLSDDLVKRFGKGFSVINLRKMRSLYLGWPLSQIRQTVSVEFEPDAAIPIPQTLSSKSQKFQTVSEKFTISDIAKCFPLPWSHYVRLLSLKNPEARSFYQKEALRGGWTVRQLERQIGTQFYERTALSRNKAAMLKKGEKALPGDAFTPEEEIKDPFVLEFLGLKDEYPENDLEGKTWGKYQFPSRELLT